jgi:hypothetical protein
MHAVGKAIFASLLLGAGSAQAAMPLEGDQPSRAGSDAAPLIRLAQGLPSDVEQRLGIRPNSRNDDDDRRDRRRDRRDYDRDDDRWDRRGRSGLTVTIPFGAPGYFVRTLPPRTRYVYDSGRRCRVIVTRRETYRGNVVETERRECR